MQPFSSSLLVLQLCMLILCGALTVPGVLGQSWSRRSLSGVQRGVSFLEAQAVQGNAGSMGLMLPLKQKPGWVRSRKLLRAAAMGVNGSVREVGYFYVTLGIGNPTRDFQLIIDTGSTITYVPCADCKHCGKHKDAPFDPKQSKSARMLACGVPKCNCGSPACQCVNNKCYYSRTYAERSSSDGFLLEDVMAFPDVASRNTTAAAGAAGAAAASSGGKQRDVHIVFGCEYSETGEIFRQTADGILGLGNNNNALQSQLVEQKVIDDTFSLCFGYPDGGMLLLGDVPLQRESEMVFTRMKPAWQSHYYTVTISHLAVGDKKLPVDAVVYAQGYGSVLDSGTTFTYLPTPAFNAFKDTVSQAVADKGVVSTPGPDPQYRDICWKGGPQDIRQLHTVFPLIDMVFVGNATLTMRPLQYLFKAGAGVFCLGVFDNNNQGTLIGGITVRDVLVKYDRRNNRAGFLPLNSCSELNSWVSPLGDRSVIRSSPAGQAAGKNGSIGSTAGQGPAVTSKEQQQQQIIAGAPQPSQPSQQQQSKGSQADDSKAGGGAEEPEQQDAQESVESQQDTQGSGSKSGSSNDNDTTSTDVSPTGGHEEDVVAAVPKHSVVKVLDGGSMNHFRNLSLPMTIMLVAVLGIGIVSWQYRSQLKTTFLSLAMVSDRADAGAASLERQGLLGTASSKQTGTIDGSELEPMRGQAPESVHRV